MNIVSEFVKQVFSIMLVAVFPILLALGSVLQAFHHDLSASPTLGSAPLSVNFDVDFSGYITSSNGVFLNFGDGSDQEICPPGVCTANLTVIHTYHSPGTYQATLVANQYSRATGGYTSEAVEALGTTTIIVR